MNPGGKLPVTFPRSVGQIPLYYSTSRPGARPTRATGGRAGDEVVQLYIHDPVASIEQPVRRLRGFQRVTLEPGETKTFQPIIPSDRR